MLMNRMNKRLLLSAILVAALSAGICAPVVAQVNVDQVIQEGEKRADAGAAEQQRVEQIANQTDDLLNEFNTVSKVVDGLVTYNSLLQRQVNKKLSDFRKQGYPASHTNSKEPPKGWKRRRSNHSIIKSWI